MLMADRKHTEAQNKTKQNSVHSTSSSSSSYSLLTALCCSPPTVLGCLTAPQAKPLPLPRPLPIESWPNWSGREPILLREPIGVCVMMCVVGESECMIGIIPTHLKRKRPVHHVILDVSLSASSPRNLAKDLQGRYAAPLLHTASDQKLEVGVRPWNKACVIHLPLFRPWQTSSALQHFNVIKYKTDSNLGLWHMRSVQ